ncbi:fasciclin domain-containing protein [Chitinophaga skermanii]|uniref:Fasciclin domain-containing protein n=1 Tax=Chitinophaga skermanii TaxID=331697 RepID=A0A327QVQ0_9BACT|nr:fasciclin domain-containing protein [Chitinophaga skermanii]RAJ08736.1 fasciclin domain-containing protein [Chitinophaga skermanii]
MKTNLYKVVLGAMVMLTVFSACRKEEFTPPPHGDKVPFSDTATHFIHEMVLASNNKLFAKAMQKSSMVNFFESQTNKARFTILMPTDEAMRAMGYTDAVIDAASQASMDSLIQYQTIATDISEEELKSITYTTRYMTLLQNKNYLEQINPVNTNVSRYETYTYKQYLGFLQGNIIVNGWATGNMVAPIYGKNGFVYTINKMNRYPTKTMMEVLETDPRFDMIGELLAYNKAYWSEITFDIYERSYWNPMMAVNGVVGRFGAFIPTNAALKANGFQTVDDLKNRDLRTMPYLDWDTFEIFNGFATDSMLNYALYGSMYLQNTGGWGIGGFTSSTLFSNDLVQPGINSYILNVKNMDAPARIIPFDFSTDANGKTTVSLKKDKNVKAVITEPNIMTLQGPIQGIDNILVPPGFQLH